jgi:hypothetical protein
VLVRFVDEREQDTGRAGGAGMLAFEVRARFVLCELKRRIVDDAHAFRRFDRSLCSSE